MLPQTLFMPTGFGYCKCPPTVVGGELLVTSERTYNITTTPLDDYDVTGIGVLLLTAAAPTSITGLVGTDGQLLFIWNIDATVDNITLEHNDAGSAAANRFYLPGAVDMVLGHFDGVLLRYSASIASGVGGWLAVAG